MALPRRFPVAVLSVVLMLLVWHAPAPAAAANRPDLTAMNGSVRPSGDHAERIIGKFTVRNAGNQPARASTAYVQVKAQGAWRYLTELRILRLAPKKNARYSFNTKRRDFIGLGSSYPVRVCLDVKKKIKEAREGNNCERLGTLNYGLVDDEVDYQPDTKFFHQSGGIGYYGWVPSGYDDTGKTLTTVFLWLHGCGGRSEFDIEAFHAKPEEDFITLAPVGREGDCWNTPGNDQLGDEQLLGKVLEDAARHFNLDLENIVLGGYSSGGDLAYRTGYLFSSTIAAVLVANTTPFRDTGRTPAVLAGIEREFRVVHLAHTSDDTYPLEDYLDNGVTKPGVKSELKFLTDSQFPVTFIERPGDHYNEPGENGLPGTDADIQTYLLPQVDP